MHGLRGFLLLLLCALGGGEGAGGFLAKLCKKDPSMGEVCMRFWPADKHQWSKVQLKLLCNWRPSWPGWCTRTAFPTPLPTPRMYVPHTASPTRAPSAAPTHSPTAAPTPSPTPSPTPRRAHQCYDGSHGCDQNEGGTCLMQGDWDYVCGCKQGYWETSPHDPPKSAHKCMSTEKRDRLPTSAPEPEAEPTPAPVNEPAYSAPPTHYPTPAPTPAPPTPVPTPMPPCDAGKYFRDEGDDDEPCLICPHGRYQDQPHQFACHLCPLGRIDTPERTRCKEIVCPPGGCPHGAVLSDMLPAPKFTDAPTPPPTPSPILSPTVAPTPPLSRAPTWSPTRFPTSTPTAAPTPAPTETPTPAPTPPPTPSDTMKCAADMFRLVLSWQGVESCVHCPAGQYRMPAEVQDACHPRPTPAPTRAPTPQPTPRPTPAPPTPPPPTPLPVCENGASALQDDNEVKAAGKAVPVCACPVLLVTAAEKRHDCSGRFKLVDRVGGYPRYMIERTPSAERAVFLFRVRGSWAFGHDLSAAPYTCVASSTAKAPQKVASGWHFRDGLAFKPTQIIVRCLHDSGEVPWDSTITTTTPRPTPMPTPIPTPVPTRTPTPTPTPRPTPPTAAPTPDAAAKRAARALALTRKHRAGTDDDDTPAMSESVRIATIEREKASSARRSLFITGALFATGCLLAIGGLLRAAKSFTHPVAVQPTNSVQEHLPFVPVFSLETTGSTTTTAGARNQRAYSAQANSSSNSNSSSSYGGRYGGAASTESLPVF